MTIFFDRNMLKEFL